MHSRLLLVTPEQKSRTFPSVSPRYQCYGTETRSWDHIRLTGRAAGGNPAGVIWCEAASGKHAVDMGMMLQSLVPGMEHTEEADLGSKVPRIGARPELVLSAA